jgi:hypothetical protein
MLEFFEIIIAHHCEVMYQEQSYSLWCKSYVQIITT